MPKYSIALLFLAFTLISCNEFGESQEFSFDTDEPEPQVSFLGFGGDADTGEVTISSFEFPDLFNTSVIVDSVQEIMEPINEKIESMGQQIDDAFAWIGDGLQDVIEVIQAPIDQHIDTVLTWVGVEETKENPEKIMMNNENGEEGFSFDETYYMIAKKSLEEEEISVYVELPYDIEEEEEFFDGEEEGSFNEEAEFEYDSVIFEEVQPIVTEIEMPIRAPMEDIGEVVVLVGYDDILAAMGSPNSTVEAIEGEPFFVRFYEFFMGKEIELELKSAGLTPVEESKRKSQFLSYDAL